MLPHLNTTLPWITSGVSQAAVELRRFLKEDVAELFYLSSKVVQKSKLFPTSFKEYESYTQSDWLDVLPHICVILVAVSYPFLLFREQKNVRYVKVRSALLRGCALCYGCGRSYWVIGFLYGFWGDGTIVL